MIVTEKKSQVSQYNPGQKPTAVVVLSAVAGDENKTWSKYTPSGTISLAIDNPEAYDTFEIGKTYFVDFSDAPLKESDEKESA
jgi:hypothetical protein